MFSEKSNDIIGTYLENSKLHEIFDNHNEEFFDGKIVFKEDYLLKLIKNNKSYILIKNDNSDLINNLSEYLKKNPKMSYNKIYTLSLKENIILDDVKRIEFNINKNKLLFETNILSYLPNSIKYISCDKKFSCENISLNLPNSIKFIEFNRNLKNKRRMPYNTTSINIISMFGMSNISILYPKKTKNINRNNNNYFLKNNNLLIKVNKIIENNKVIGVSIIETNEKLPPTT